MFTKQTIYQLLNDQQIAYEAVEHSPVYTIEEMDALNLPHSDKIVKNLFLRDDKKRNYYLITLPGHKTVNLKAMSTIIPSRKLSFANEAALWDYLKLEQGHVTPLGALNNTHDNLTVVFDQVLDRQLIGIHPLENNATIFVQAKDMISLIESHEQAVLMREF